MPAEEQLISITSSTIQQQQQKQIQTSTNAAAAADTKQSILICGSDQLPTNYTPERSLSVATASMDALMRPLRKHSSLHRMSPSLKSAIHTMLCIVASYLLSNTLHLILTMLERSDSALLKHPTDPNLASTFHTTFSDMVSFVYMFTSAFRILIYYACNPTIRNDFSTFMR